MQIRVKTSTNMHVADSWLTLLLLLTPVKLQCLTYSIEPRTDKSQVKSNLLNLILLVIEKEVNI